MLGFDEMIQKNIRSFINKINLNRTKSKEHGRKGLSTTTIPRNPISASIDRNITRIRLNIKKNPTIDKQKLYPLLKEIKQLKHKRLHTRYNDPNRSPFRFLYVRYADDWIILSNFNNKLSIHIKKIISKWLLDERKAILSDEKTIITDIRKKPAHFLGFEIYNKQTRLLKKIIQNKKQILKRITGWQITLGIDKKRIINRLYMKGYCSKVGFPINIPWLSTMDTYTIIEKFNSVIVLSQSDKWFL